MADTDTAAPFEVVMGADFQRAEQKIPVEAFTADLDSPLDSLTLAAFTRTHQAPRTRDEWTAALNRFTTGRI